MGNWSNYTTTRLTAANSLFFLVEGKKEGGVVQPIGLYVTASGILLGHEWKPITGRVRSSRYPNISYNVLVSHEWKLLGASLYTTTEEYSGHISTIKTK